MIRTMRYAINRTTWRVASSLLGIGVLGLGLTTIAEAQPPGAPTGAPTQAAAPQSPAQAQAAKAVPHLQKGEWDQALQEAEKALQMDANCADALIAKGQALTGKGDYDNAIKELEKAANLPGQAKENREARAMAHAKKARTLYLKGEFLKAIDSAYFATLEKYDLVEAYVYRAEAYIARNQYDKAIEMMNRVVYNANIGPKSAEAWSLAGLAYIGKGQYDTAIAHENKALECNSSYAPALERRAQAYLAKNMPREGFKPNQDEIKKMMADLEAAYKLTPNSPDLLLTRAQILLINKNTKDALSDIAAVLKAEPKNYRALYLKGMMQLEGKNADEALSNFDKSIEARDTFAPAYLARGQIKLNRKESEEALKDFSKAIQLDPSLAAAYKSRAEIYRKLNQSKEATADSTKYKDLVAAAKPLTEKEKKEKEKEKEKEKKHDPLYSRFVVESKGVSPDRRKEMLASAKEIDRLVQKNYEKYNIKPNPLTTDDQFVRRAYLDITGAVPTYQQYKEFTQVTSKESKNTTDKRSKLIDDLLANDGYAGHQFNYWSDVLRVTDRLKDIVTGVPYRQWLKQSFAENKPWDKMVYEMMTAEGAVWQNPASGYLLRDANMPLDSINNTIRIFVGTRIGCAQCHNHPFDRWTQREFYQMAAFTFGTLSNADFNDKRFAEKNPYTRLNDEYQLIEQEEEDRRNNYYRLNNFIATQTYRVNDVDRKITLPADYHYDDAKPGTVIEPKALFGSPAEFRPGEPPRVAFARWLTSKDNPRFAKTIANRLWKQVFGVGQIEPVDDMMDDTVAENPELMTFLESEMKRLDFDMKEFLRILLNTETYQRQCCYEEVAMGEPYHFPGPILRRMTAEQAWDSFLTLAVTDPNEYREINAKALTECLDVDLNTVSAEKVLASDSMMGKMMYGQGPRQSKYIYKNVLLGKAAELPSPNPPNHFLRMFGQSDREGIATSSTQGSVPQVLFMFNGPITHMLLEPNSTIATNVLKKKADPERVKVIFHTILNRDPDEHEMELALKEVRSVKGLSGYGNVIWSLVNTREFLFVQ